MNKWEKRRKFSLDSINAMVTYAKSINSDTESDEYKDALFYWATDLSNSYQKEWELENGSLEEETDGGLYELI